MTTTSNIRPLKEVALVTRDPQLGRTIAELLGKGGTHLRMMADGLHEARGAGLPELAIIDVDLAAPAERDELERVLTAYADRVAFVVTSRSPTVEGMRLLMRHGIVDLLPQPLVADELTRAVKLAGDGLRRRAAPTKGEAEAAPRGALVSVIRAGGGAGGTTIATQAACAATKAGWTEGQVCLIDFDLQFGSAAFHLGLPQRTHLLDLIEAGERLDGSMLKTTMARHPSGVDVLAAPPGIHPLDALTPELATQLLSEARRHYRLTVVDLPLAWTAGSRAALVESDRILLVAQPTMPSLRHARRQIETLQEEGLDHIPLWVVANKVPSGLFADGLNMRDMASALGRRIDHSIPAESRLQEAANLGKTLSDLGATRTVKRLAALLDGLPQPAAAS